jgi:hypothetical protein
MGPDDQAVATTLNDLAVLYNQQRAPRHLRGTLTTEQEDGE